jgi:transcriptional regulator with XRE-family HTH domain
MGGDARDTPAAGAAWPRSELAGCGALVPGFGLALRQLRAGRGWSQERLAEQSGLNRSYVGEIERGCVIASLATVEKLALALELAPSALLRHGEALSARREGRGRDLMAIDG